jgi:sec-independent protein translocase protein TatB
MFSLSPVKIALIVAVMLIVLGPDKLPEVARQVGAMWKSAKQWQQKVESEVRDVVPDLPSTADIARIARSPVHLLNSLADRVAEPIDDEAPASEDAEASHAEPAEVTVDKMTFYDTSTEPEPEPTPAPNAAPPSSSPSPVMFADPSLN